MIELNIPGCENLRISDVVFDFNGTLACDGILIEGVADRLIRLSSLVKIHVLTADTYKTVHKVMKDLPCIIHVIDNKDQDRAKAEYCEEIGRSGLIAVGNGNNDALMMKVSALGFLVLQEEGASPAALVNADIIFKSINDAIDALFATDRLRATLRN